MWFEPAEQMREQVTEGEKHVMPLRGHCQILSYHSTHLLLTGKSRSDGFFGQHNLVVDLTAKNTGSGNPMIDASHQMNLRDEKDQYYACNFGGVAVTGRNQESWRNEIAPGEIRRGQVGFQVPLDAQKLFFVVRAERNKERIFISLVP
jgi:hypothetical protein